VTAQDQLRDLVRNALLDAGIRQAAVARELSASPKHINQMLTGKAPMGLPWAERIVAVCGLRVTVGLELDDPAACVHELFAGGLA